MNYFLHYSRDISSENISILMKMFGSIRTVVLCDIFLLFVILVTFRCVKCENSDLKFRCTKVFLCHYGWGFGDRSTCKDEESKLLIHSPKTQISGALSVDGVTLNATTKTAIESLFILDAKMKFLPSNMKNIFPNLKGFSFDNCGIIRVTRADMKQFSDDLIYASFNKNSLYALEYDIFEYNTNLTYVNFNGNPLKFVDFELLTNLIKIEGLRYAGFAADNSSSCVKQEYHRKDSFTWNNTCLDMSDFIEQQYDGAVASIASMIADNEHLAKKMIVSSEIIQTLLQDVPKRNEHKIMNFSCVVEELKVEKSLWFHISIANTTCTTEIEYENSFIDQVHFRNLGNSTEDVMIETVQVSQITMMFLPLNLGEKFNGIKNLSIVETGLLKIRKESFKNLKKLKILNLSGNLIVDLPDGIFDHLTQLEELNLEKNQVRRVNAEILAPLANLQNVNLAKNSIRVIKNDLIGTSSKSVKSFDLRNNICINSRYPRESIKVIESKINENCIAPVPLSCSTIETMCKAKNLKVTEKWSKLFPLDFDNVNVTKKSITSLVISQQIAIFLPYQISTKFPDLEEIVVDDSKLSALLTSDFTGLLKIKIIQITNNNITTIESDVFNNLQLLENLDLSSNEIRMLPAHIFASLSNLKVLNLSYNKLSRFEVKLLPNQNKIDQFYLNGNEIQHLGTQTLDKLQKSCKIIDFSENKCIDRLFDQGGEDDRNGQQLWIMRNDIIENCTSIDDDPHFEMISQNPEEDSQLSEEDFDANFYDLFEI